MLPRTMRKFRKLLKLLMMQNQRKLPKIFLMMSLMTHSMKKLSLMQPKFRKLLHQKIHILLQKVLFQTELNTP